MTLAYTAAIKLDFDKPITNNPEILSPDPVLELEKTLGTIIYSSYYSSSYHPEKAFDGSTSGYWRAGSSTPPQWIGMSWATPKTFMKMRAYLSSYKPSGYIVQGSDDGSVWTDVVSGSFTSADGWQDINFTPTTFKQWRLYITSFQSSRVYIYEIEFYNAKAVYNTQGWLVTGFEPEMSPNLDGVLVPKTYEVFKVTKTADDMSVILWLARKGRMRYPQGQVTVDFSGDLRGEGNVSVNSFTQSFTPVNINDPVFNPSTLERVELKDILVNANLTPVQYTSSQSSDEQIRMSLFVTAVLTPVTELP